MRRLYTTLREAIEATVKDIVEMAQAEPRGFNARIVQQGTDAIMRTIEDGDNATLEEMEPQSSTGWRLEKISASVCR